MIDFALDDGGDVVIENGDISIVVGDGLLRQRVRTVLMTNLKEWFFDWEQGIDFGNVLGKTNAELVRYEVERGLAQVDGTFVITEFAYDEDRSTRAAQVRFTARSGSGDIVGGKYTWG